MARCGQVIERLYDRRNRVSHTRGWRQETIRLTPFSAIVYSLDEIQATAGGAFGNRGIENGRGLVWRPDDRLRLWADGPGMRVISKFGLELAQIPGLQGVQIRIGK